MSRMTESFSFFARHRVAAVFDDDYLACVILYIRQRVDKNPCALRV